MSATTEKNISSPCSRWRLAQPRAGRAAVTRSRVAGGPKRRPCGTSGQHERFRRDRRSSPRIRREKVRAPSWREGTRSIRNREDSRPKPESHLPRLVAPRRGGTRGGGFLVGALATAVRPRGQPLVSHRTGPPAADAGGTPRECSGWDAGPSLKQRATFSRTPGGRTSKRTRRGSLTITTPVAKKGKGLRKADRRVSRQATGRSGSALASRETRRSRRPCSVWA